MPTTDTAAQPRNELVSSRVTQGMKRKIRKLAAIKDSSESELLYEKAKELADEYDRIIAAATEDSSA